MIEWVVHEGIVVRVQTFAALAPRTRPLVTCPECHERVVMHLGRTVRHHAVHYAASSCRLTSGESALHFNVKHHIAGVLQRAAATERTLHVVRTCGAAGCGATSTRLWLEGWDAVSVEHRVVHEGAARVPDIAVHRGGRVVGAIEVRATNEVSEPRAAAFAGMGIPFVEVLARRSVIEPPTEWAIADPLEVVRDGAESTWRCPRHLEVRRASRLHAARVVDILFGDGSSLRRVFRVDVHYADGVARSLELTCAGDRVARVPLDGAADSDARRRAFALIAAAFDDDVAAHARGGAAIVDSPMRWAHASVARAIVAAEGEGRPGRRLLLWSRYPRRYRYVKGKASWWMPPEMRDIDWDREEGALLGEHPQWLRVRETARERYKRARDEEEVS